jgi:DNA polymerase III sliding clamp (beta) subunit (PCNA family)
MNPITIPVAELRPALAGLGKVIPRRSTLPVLGHIRIERTRDGHIGLAATDLDTSAAVRLAAPATGAPLSLLIPHEELGNITKSCARNDTLLIAPTEDGRITLRFPLGRQTVEYSCDTLPAEEFPALPKFGSEPVPVPDEVRSHLREALDCASTDETRLILNGAFLDVSTPGAHHVVGTDGRHLFSANSFALPLPSSFVLPSHRFLGWKPFQEASDWRLRVAMPEKDGPVLYEIAAGNWRFSGRSPEGSYPNWRQVVPEKNAFRSTIEVLDSAVEELIRTVGRMPCHDSINHAIGLKLCARRLLLLGKSPGAERWTEIEAGSAVVKGEQTTVFLNRQFLVKALRFGLTRIELIDALSPLRFSRGGRQMIVMPTRPETTPAAPRFTPPAAAPLPNATPPSPAEAQEQPPRKENQTMPEHTNGNGSAIAGANASRSASTPAAGASEAPNKPALETAVAQAESVRSDFRSAIAGLNKLVDALKAAQREQKSQEKEISSVRQTLRSLQSVRI